MKLSEWARKNNLTYQTAHRLFKKGQLPVKAVQLDSGTILIYENEDVTPSDTSITIYARVSSADQKEDLKRQVERLNLFAAAKGYVIKEVVTEIGSGLNQGRKKLNALLRDKDVSCILVEHRDRLTRFGFDLISSALASSNRSIVVMNETEDDMDLVQDFIDVITSMCARIYGKRSAKNKAEQMKGILEKK